MYPPFLIASTDRFEYINSDMNSNKRPLTVLFAQIVLFFVATFLLLDLTRVTPLLDKAVRTSNSKWLLLYLYELVRFVMYAAAFLGMLRRKRYGRWLAVATFGLSSVLGVFNLSSALDGSIPQGRYMSQAVFISVLVGEVILFMFFTARIAFAENVTKYFSEPIEDLR